MSFEAKPKAMFERSEFPEWRTYTFFECVRWGKPQTPVAMLSQGHSPFDAGGWRFPHMPGMAFLLWRGAV